MKEIIIPLTSFLLTTSASVTLAQNCVNYIINARGERQCLEFNSPTPSSTPIPSQPSSPPPENTRRCSDFSQNDWLELRRDYPSKQTCIRTLNSPPCPQLTYYDVSGKLGAGNALEITNNRERWMWCDRNSGVEIEAEFSGENRQLRRLTRRGNF